MAAPAPGDAPTPLELGAGSGVCEWKTDNKVHAIAYEPLSRCLITVVSGKDTPAAASFFLVALEMPAMDADLRDVAWHDLGPAQGASWTMQPLGNGSFWLARQRSAERIAWLYTFKERRFTYKTAVDSVTDALNTFAFIRNGRCGVFLTGYDENDDPYMHVHDVPSGAVTSIIDSENIDVHETVAVLSAPDGASELIYIKPAHPGDDSQAGQLRSLPLPPAPTTDNVPARKPVPVRVVSSPVCDSALIPNSRRVQCGGDAPLFAMQTAPHMLSLISLRGAHRQQPRVVATYTLPRYRAPRADEMLMLNYVFWRAEGVLGVHFRRAGNSVTHIALVPVHHIPWRTAVEVGLVPRDLRATWRALAQLRWLGERLAERPAGATTTQTLSSPGDLRLTWSVLPAEIFEEFIGHMWAAVQGPRLER